MWAELSDGEEGELEETGRKPADDESTEDEECGEDGSSVTLLLRMTFTSLTYDVIDA